MSDQQRPKRVSVTVREGPKEESRVEKTFREGINDVFSCCESETTCLHRKSLSYADRKLSATTWQKVSDIPAEIYSFAMESVAGPPESEDTTESAVARRQSGTVTAQTGDPLQDDNANLDDFKRAVKSLKSPHKSFASSNFDRFIRENEARAMLEVWPQLEQELRQTATEESYNASFHDAAAAKLPLAVVDLYKSGNGSGARKLLSLIFDFILSDFRDISALYATSLEKLVESCNSADVQKDIFPTIVGRFTSTRSTVNGKIGACRLLRKLATRFNHEVVQKKFFPLMETLSRDASPFVRGAAALNVSEMIHRLRLKEPALQFVTRGSEDEDPGVRTGITIAIVQSAILMNPADEKNKKYLETVMQIIKTLVKNAYVNGNIDLLIGYSECMGRICQIFYKAGVMKPRDVLWYLDTYLQLSRYNSTNFNDQGRREETGADLEEADTMPTGFANFRANVEFSRRQSIVEQLLSTKPEEQEEREAMEIAASTAHAIAVLRTNTQERRMSIPYGGQNMLAQSVCLRYFGPEVEQAHDCRLNAAKEFVEFMQFAKPVVDFRHGLHPLMVDLMHDAQPEVRGAMAANILPIMEYLGSEAALLHGELVYALTDDDLDVIQALVPHIAKILECLVKAKVLTPERITPKLVEIGGAILYCEERLNQSTFYNVHQNLLEQFSIIPYCLPGDYIYSNFTPALFHRLRHMRQTPCRLAAANALVIFLHQCPRLEYREDMRKRIKEGFAQGRGVHERMLFLYMAKKIMEKFTRKYFRDHFFQDVLALANDPVSNVRRKVIELLPDLKDAVDDTNIHRKMEESVRNARKSETDRDVKVALEETLTKLQLRQASYPTKQKKFIESGDPFSGGSDDDS